jgi:Domain of Unknown Function (DUF1080)
VAALPSTILAVLLVLALSLPSASAASDGGVARPSAEGWITLFNGRTTAGWAMSGPGRFRVQGGALVSSGGMGLLWYTRRSFRNFELMVDWRVAEQCDNSGVFVRFPRRPGSPVDAVNSGYEVQIDDCDPRGLSHRTGSIYDHAPAARLVSRVAGRWNRFRIRVVDQHYMVFLNGALVTQLHGARARVGYVGLQNHDPGSRVSFRRIRARPLR